MQKKFNLSNMRISDKVEPVQINKEELFEHVLNYLRFERRYTENSIEHMRERIREIVFTYNVSIPTAADAVRIEQDRRARGNGDTTITQYLKALKAVAWAQKIDLKIKMPKQTKRIPPALTPPECRALLSAALNLRDRAIVAILLYCGLRNKELCSLSVGDIDVKNKIVYVRDNGEGTKNRHERMAIMTAECAAILSEYIIQRPEGISPLLFFTEAGDAISRHRLEMIIGAIAKRSGIGKRIYPHMLRHTCANLMIRSNVALPDVALQLGHRQISTTTNFYLHGDYAGLKQSIARFII